MSDASGKAISNAAGKQYRGEAVAGPGGVMTDEAGVITGDLTVAITLSNDQTQAQVRVQYTGAEEWYTMTGSPVPLAGRTAQAVRSAIVRAVRDRLPEELPDKAGNR
ncbi:hypothetical protein [Streptosporangium vulgare]|uniref:Uncharacterized protein n=1 Tax=Streptosporangium vulgare TaxID=46190 RepID=A0ABV5TRA8_9ACTN